MTADAEIRAAAQRYLVERPRVELSVVGRGKSRRADSALTGRWRPPSAPQPRVSAAVAPQILEARLRNPALGLSARRLADGRRSDRDARRGGPQPPAEAGLAQLTAAMLDEGTRLASREQIALAAESMGATITATCGWDGAYVAFNA